MNNIDWKEALGKAFNVPANLPIWMIIVGAVVAIGIGKNRHEVNTVNAQSGIGVWHILRICNGIYNILDSHSIVLVPNQTHLVVLCMYATSIVANVPSTCEVLCKTSNVATIGVHQSEVAIGLQQCCSELGAWSNR